jgi:hypothetical protein
MSNAEQVDVAARQGASVQSFDAAVRRAEAEFREMPGLKLTQAQAARLWSCDVQLADAVLCRLAESLFLVRTRRGPSVERAERRFPPISVRTTRRARAALDDPPRSPRHK